MRSIFQVEATEEQIEYTKRIVQYSIDNHTVPNIWDKDILKKKQTSFYRFIGSLGEVLFADVYHISRHEKSFGASDGQDNGKDFIIDISGVDCVVDLKSMHRKNDVFYKNYVLNIPYSQVHKPDSATDFYYLVSIHNYNSKYFASFLGFVKKGDILQGKVGNLFKAGTTRVRGNNTTFTFLDDTYEITFEEITPPYITHRMQQMKNFKLISLNN